MVGADSVDGFLALDEALGVVSHTNTKKANHHNEQFLIAKVLDALN